MPTYGMGSTRHHEWLRSKQKHFRGSEILLGGIRYRIVTREFNRATQLYDHWIVRI